MINFFNLLDYKPGEFLETEPGGVRELVQLYKPMNQCVQARGIARIATRGYTACGPGASCWGVSVVSSPNPVFTDQLQARQDGEQEGLGVWTGLTGGLLSGGCPCDKDVNADEHVSC